MTIEPYTKIMLARITAGLFVSIFLAAPVLAQSALPAFTSARPIADPSLASRAEFGRLNRSGDISLYAVKPAKDVTVNVEAVVPVRPSNRDFRPAVAVFVPGTSGPAAQTPFPVPTGYQATVIPPETSADRPTVFEPRSIEKFYHGNVQSISFPANQTRYVAVYSPDRSTGDFVLGLGSSANFENVSVSSLIAQGLALKFGVAPGREIPWGDLVGLFLSVLGLSAGLASILAGFLPRPSAARHNRRFNRMLIITGATGLVLFYVGLRFLFRDTGATGLGSFMELVAVVLLVLGGWYALKTWNEPPERIRWWFVSLWKIGWVVEAALLAWYVLLGR